MAITYTAVLEAELTRPTGARRMGVHWREALIETLGLGGFIVSAVVFTALLQHPSSPVRQSMETDIARRAWMGIAMGVTAAAIFYSPWGQRSGAHLNPAVTLTFLRLGRITPRDAVAYSAAQFAGAACGMLIAITAMRPIVQNASVNYVATVPGSAGVGAAFVAELAISFGMMVMVLIVSNSRFARYTGACAASLIAAYIVVESPLSGMSMNPARSFAPALAAGSLGSVWIYFIAPPAGMLLAAEAYVRCCGIEAVRCAKMLHPSGGDCHFNCGYGRATRQLPTPNAQLPK